MKIDCDGLVAFHVGIKLDGDSLRLIPADSIRALFDGLAKAIVAAGTTARINVDVDHCCGRCGAETTDVTEEDFGDGVWVNTCRNCIDSR